MPKSLVNLFLLWYNNGDSGDIEKESLYGIFFKKIYT